MTDIERLIAAADFTEHDLDAGTSGFCAMFALALYRAVINQHPTLVLLGAKNGNGDVAQTGKGMWWGHAAVKVGGEYYDIEGRQRPEWMIDNYTWSVDPLKTKNLHGAIIELTPEDFVNEVRTTKNARDWRFYTMCKKKFIQAKENLNGTRI